MCTCMCMYMSTCTEQGVNIDVGGNSWRLRSSLEANARAHVRWYQSKGSGSLFFGLFVVVKRWKGGVVRCC